MQIGSFQEKGVGKAQMEALEVLSLEIGQDRMIVRAGIPVDSIGTVWPLNVN